MNDFTDAEIDALRWATPGCTHVAHFNHSGASLPSQGTLDAIVAQLQREALSGPMEAANENGQLLENTRQAAARLLNAETHSIAFTSSGSTAWGMAFNALGNWHPGERILVSRHEWGGNLACMARAVEAGATLEVIPCESDGTVSVDALEKMIDNRVRLIALTWLPANGGLINPAQLIGEVAQRHGIPYFIDAGQAVGQLPCDVQALRCDVLKSAGRKFLRGPRGTALLYIKPDFVPRLTPALVDVQSGPWDGQAFGLRDDARRFETSELSWALLAGLGNALKEANALGLGKISRRITALSRSLRESLQNIAGIELHDLGSADQRSGIVSFNLKGWDAFELKEHLNTEGINIGANAVPYTPLDMQARGLNSIARISVSHWNNQQDIERLLNRLRGLAR